MKSTRIVTLKMWSQKKRRSFFLIVEIGRSKLLVGSEFQSLGI